MPEKSATHAFVAWAKQRLDEMDATLASIEKAAGEARSDAKAKADELVTAMKQHRDAFAAKATAHVEAGEAALRATKTQLESQWTSFEARVKTYFNTVGKEFAQQQATFRNVAAAQAKAWREAADGFQAAAKSLAAEKRAETDAAIARMRADAAEAEARVQKAKDVAGQSWAALSAALAQSRRAFDEANQKVSDALKQASTKG